MAVIKSFPVLLFEEKKVGEPLNVTVPVNSKLLQLKVLHDGVYAWYEVPQIDSDSTIVHTYIVIKKDSPIPEGAEFITVLDTIIDTPNGQGVMIFPIFKLK